MNSHPSDKTADNPRAIFAGLCMIALAGIAIRVALIDQSLWYDEMVTLLHYVLHPWKVIVSGVYSPNNHVLFTLLAKACTELTGESAIAAAIRVPSILAGCLAGVLLAWPLRREQPRMALVLALLGVSHPWLVSFSGWARGYALLLFLCIAATQLLFAGRWRWYILAMTAALYTQPLAILVAVAHGAAILILRAPAAIFHRWLPAIAVTGLLSAGLYAPFFAGARNYFAQPQRASLSYPQFLDQSIRCAQAGDPISGAIHLVLPLIVIGVGLRLVWGWTALRPLVVTFAGASLLGLVVPLAVPAAGETRAMLWLIPVHVLAVFGLVSASRGRVLVAVILPLGFFAMRAHDLIARPAQPIREAIAEARALADGGPVVGVYMASAEARLVYGLSGIAYTLDPHRDLPSLRSVETSLPRRPVLVVFYPEYVRRDQPDLAAYLRTNYERIRVLPGRVSDAEIWVGKQ